MVGYTWLGPEDTRGDPEPELQPLRRHKSKEVLAEEPLRGREQAHHAPGRGEAGYLKGPPRTVCEIHLPSLTSGVRHFASAMRKVSKTESDTSRAAVVTAPDHVVQEPWERLGQSLESFRDAARKSRAGMS